MRRLVTYIILIVLCSSISAQGYITKTNVTKLQFHFRYDDSRLSLDYMNNRKSYTLFKQYIEKIGFENIDSITIVSTSSPEGSVDYNARLTHKRSEAIFRFLTQKDKKLMQKMIVTSKVESWKELRTQIANDPILAQDQKDEAIRIIDNAPSLALRKKLLAMKDYYEYIKEAYYTVNRYSVVNIYQTVKIKKVGKRPADAYRPSLPYPVGVITPKGRFRAPQLKTIRMEAPEPPQRTLFTIKTNLLYDAITAVNVAVEVPLGKKWSVEVEDVCPWWHNGNKWAFQYWQMGAEPRYWFKRTDARDVLSGHFGGVYGMGGKYDLQNRRKICYQGEFWSAGVTYGYALPVGKHFNMEFSLSVGFMSTRYRHYTPSVDWDELVADPYKRGKFSYFGPTKAKISLIYPIKIKYRKKGVRHD